MEKNYIRATEIKAVGFHFDTGDVIVKASLDESNDMLFAFPADDIPNLMLMLSRAYAGNITGKNVDESLRLATPVDNAQFHLCSDKESIGLLADLAAGTPISLSFERPVADKLRKRLNQLFDAE